MSFEIKIYNPKDLSSRSYINIKINGKWVKEYNGNKIGIDIKPNLASTFRKRSALLTQLEYSFKKAIDSGIYPVKEKKPDHSTEYVLQQALKKKQTLNLNHNYIRNLKYIHDAFIRVCKINCVKGCFPAPRGWETPLVLTANLTPFCQETKPPIFVPLPPSS
ncbi:MAG TPA: hypothetical protein VK017_02385, partial [Sphingobacterium sp.]|nr:hypothetical protein [Sphingobacterium sp.]